MGLMIRIRIPEGAESFSLRHNEAANPGSCYLVAEVTGTVHLAQLCPLPSVKDMLGFIN
jgi:hypothetical protein